MSRLGTVGLSACALLVCAGIAKVSDSAEVATPAAEAKARRIQSVDVVNPVETENIAKIRQALDAKTKVDFKEEPLSSVIAQLASQHQIEIQLDAKVLEEASIAVDTKLTCSRHDISLHSALRSLLRPKDLTYIIRDESLMITTPDVAMNELVTRVYPVGDLLAGPHQRGPFGRNNYQQIIDNITSTIGPTTWDEVGGPGSVQQFTTSQSLVVSQTDAMHEQIVELLSALRQARDAQPPPPQPTAVDSLIDAVESISAAWHRGRYQSIPPGMMGGRLGGGLGGGSSPAGAGGSPAGNP